MKKVVLNADDFGLTGGICTAIERLLFEGKISNTTAMICAKGGAARLRSFRDASFNAKIGLHLQLTSGHPILPVKRVASLTSTDGSFKKKEAFSTMRTSEVEAEWRAAVELFKEIMGRSPSHIDSHHGPHRHPEFRKIYFAISKEHGLSARGFDREYSKEAQSFGALTSDECVMGWTARAADYNKLVELISEKAALVSAGGVVEVAMHPGPDDEELNRVTSLTTLRENDIKVLDDLHATKKMTKNGFQLVSHPLKHDN